MRVDRIMSKICRNPSLISKNLIKKEGAMTGQKGSEMPAKVSISTVYTIMMPKDPVRLLSIIDLGLHAFDDLHLCCFFTKNFWSVPKSAKSPWTTCPDSNQNYFWTTNNLLNRKENHILEFDSESNHITLINKSQYFCQKNFLSNEKMLLVTFVEWENFWSEICFEINKTKSNYARTTMIHLNRKESHIL